MDTRAVSIVTILVAIMACLNTASSFGSDITADGDQRFVDLECAILGGEFYVETYNAPARAEVEISFIPDISTREFLPLGKYILGGAKGDRMFVGEHIRNGSMISIKKGAYTIVKFPWNSNFDSRQIRVFDNGTIVSLEAMG